MLLDLGLKVFQCDGCLKKALVKTFPKGWVWLKTSIKFPIVEHRCEECQSQISPKEIGGSGDHQ